MIGACATHIPLPRIPAHVVVIRGGRRLRPAPALPKRRATSPQAGSTTTPTSPSSSGTSATSTSTPSISPRANVLYLQRGDEIQVSRPASFTFSLAGNRYRILHGRVDLACRRLVLDTRWPQPHASVLALSLRSGEVRVRSGGRPRRALILTPEMLALATAPRTDFLVDRNPALRWTHAWTLNQLIVSARTADQRMRINTRATYTAISDRNGLRLDIWPFSISALQRPTTSRDRLVPYWADGLPCSVGCSAPGAIPGWPLQPFHHQHAIRAGINELRPANFHVAVDIEADDFQPVYAIQSGYATIRYPGTGDVNVDVGNFFYWHINPTVANGQYVVAYQTMIGQVLKGFGHVAFSEGSTSDYLNPLRPGGSLRPYTDTEVPVIGIPRVFADGRVIVAAFDPQSFIHKLSYETPVLAPSSLAWRLYDAHNHALTGLQWAMRGSQNYPAGLKSVIFAPGASNPGFECFFTQLRCIPNWVYWLAGGLTPPLPMSSLLRGRYRLTVYAWDWAGNTSALDYWISVPLAHAAAPPSAEFGPLSPKFDYP
ncbi:MAG: hypothetical protein ACYC91_19900 [Solirubrobacteraceae bacterium]